MQHFLNNPNIYKIHEGILSKENETTTTSAFSAEEQDRHLYLEENSWWFKHRGNCITDKIKTLFNTNDNIVDVGGGNGYNAKKIQDCGYKITIIEPARQGCMNAVKRGLFPPPYAE